MKKGLDLWEIGAATLGTTFKRYKEKEGKTCLVDIPISEIKKRIVCIYNKKVDTIYSTIPHLILENKAKKPLSSKNNALPYVNSLKEDKQR